MAKFHTCRIDKDQLITPKQLRERQKEQQKKDVLELLSTGAILEQKLDSTYKVVDKFENNCTNVENAIERHGVVDAIIKVVVGLEGHFNDAIRQMNAIMTKYRDIRLKEEPLMPSVVHKYEHLKEKFEKVKRTFNNLKQLCLQFTKSVESESDESELDTNSVSINHDLEPAY